MSDDLLYEEGEDAAAAVPELPAPKSKKKNLVIVIVAVALVLALGGGGVAWYLLKGKKAGAGGKDVAAAAAKHEGTQNFVDVPPILVNLRSADTNPHYLKVHFMLVPGPKATEAEIKDRLPLVIDAYQSFLRELRPEDLAGSAAVFRIKEELMTRARDALGDGMVDDILIQDLIQQ
jgi:flagellar FliL protein